MFATIKIKIAEYLVKKRYLNKPLAKLSFNKFFSNSISFFVIMPADEQKFIQSLDILKYLLIHKKNVTVFCKYPCVNAIREKESYKIILYRMEDISKLNLPEKNFLRKLDNKNYDIVIDLNMDENLFCSAIANFIKSDYRVGFQKEQSDKYYNFQIQNDEINTEISYRNLLNSLQMF